MRGDPLSMLVSKMSRSTFGRSPSTVFVMVQVQTGYELHAMEASFPSGNGPEEHEDLLEEFVMAAEAIVDITSAQDVVNKVFD